MTRCMGAPVGPMASRATPACEGQGAVAGLKVRPEVPVDDQAESSRSGGQHDRERH